MRRSIASLKNNLLAYDKVVLPGIESPKHTIAFMHGILGNKKNWMTPAKTFVKELPEFAAVNIDHRGHGSSILAANHSSTLTQCAEDIHDLFTDHSFRQDLGIAVSHHAAHNPQDTHEKHRHKHRHDVHPDLPPSVPTVLVGHSFGGKVALSYLKHCMMHGNPLPAVTFILDALPGLYTFDKDSKSHQQSVFDLFSILQAAPRIYPSRKVALAYLSSKGISTDLVHWLAVNLVPVAPGREEVQFSFNFDFVRGMFEDYCQTDLWDFLYEFNHLAQVQQAQRSHHSHHLGAPVESPVGRTHDHKASRLVFVRAGRNKAWTEDILKRFVGLRDGAHNPQRESHAGHAPPLSPHREEHSAISLVTMPHVGHWLHVDDMKGLVKILVDHTKPVVETA